MNKLHEKIYQSFLKLMISGLNFYYEFLLQCNFVEVDDEKCQTMGIRATLKGFEIVYNRKYIESKSDLQMNFILIHEIMHGLSKHHSRNGERNAFVEQISENGQISRVMLTNIVQDMIINHNILKSFNEKYVQKPEKEVLDVPEKYKEIHVFEKLYDWMLQNNEVKQSFCKGFDEHLEDEIPQELKDAMVDAFIEGQKAKGNVTGNIENILGELRPKKNNYLSLIKRNIANMIGKYKKSNWKRLSRRLDEIEDGLIIKGQKRFKMNLNTVLDTSGSMTGLHKKVLSYIANNNITNNLIQIDTEIKSIDKINNIKQLKKLDLKGFGGTTLSGAFKYISQNNFNNYPTILLTDGECDIIDLEGIKNDVLVLTTNQKVKFINNKVIRIKQIVIDDKE